MEGAQCDAARAVGDGDFANLGEERVTAAGTVVEAGAPAATRERNESVDLMAPAGWEGYRVVGGLGIVGIVEDGVGARVRGGWRWWWR